MFNDDYPVIVGLCGKACTGKTSTADMIAPPAISFEKTENSSIIWDHLFLAMPLYEMASIIRKTQGSMRKDRVLFQLHEVLQDLLGGSPLYGLPDYDSFIQIVRDIYDMNIVYDESVKPRSFMQQAATYCRAIDVDCFVNSIKRRSTEHFLKWRGTLDTEDDTYVCIVSDVRLENEAEWIAEQPNGVVIRFDAGEETRKERMIKRDGAVMTPEQMDHESEKVELIDDAIIDYVVPTDNLTIEEQAELTKKLVLEKIGLEIYA